MLLLPRYSTRLPLHYSMGTFHACLRAGTTLREVINIDALGEREREREERQVGFSFFLSPPSSPPMREHTVHTGVFILKKM